MVPQLEGVAETLSKSPGLQDLGDGLPKAMGVTKGVVGYLWLYIYEYIFIYLYIYI